MRVLSAVLFVGVSSCGETTPPLPSSRATVALEIGTDRCDAEYPIVADITNISQDQIDGVEFVIRGQNVGHSTFLANSGLIRTDKIMAPGEVYSICVETPMVIRPAPEDVKWNYTVEVRNVWGGQES